MDQIFGSSAGACYPIKLTFRLPMKSEIIILDFGSQYTQVIARRIRECQVYSTILPYDTPAAEIAKCRPR